MTKELFLVWIKHFHNHVKWTSDNPGLLILDGHYSHTRNMAAIDLAREDGIDNFEKLENILSPSLIRSSSLAEYTIWTKKVVGEPFIINKV